MGRGKAGRQRPNRAGPPGQGLVEYGLIMLMVAVVAVAIMLTMGQQAGGLFSGITGGLNSITGGTLAEALGDCKPGPEGGGKGLEKAKDKSKAGWCP